MRDHAYHGNKGEQEFLRAGKAGETIGLHPITIRRWITSGKIQMVRVGIKAHTLQSEIEHFIGKADARLLVLSACVSGHDQRPDLQHQIELLKLLREDRVAAEAVTSADC
jgi:putative resolvase